MGLRNFVIELAGLMCRLQTIAKIKSNERASEQLTCNETCIKEQVYFELLYMYMYMYFMKAASSSLVKCFKIVFPM